MRIFLTALISFTIFIVGLFLIYNEVTENREGKTWKLQSIDTMKYSRDRARETLTNHEIRDIIDKQVTDIANTGATHVAVGTPYDDEFLPVLKLWVDAARKNNLKVYFRGNFSGWEKWYGYEKIDRKEHIDMTKNFIAANPELFEDGDIFSSCPECENGENLNRSNNLQIESYKSFLVDEYAATKSSFEAIRKDVSSNYFSMNGDIAFRIMDKDMTKKLDGIIVIDHYVESVDQLVKDIKELSKKSGGKIVLGEFGAPIPDIHGSMSEKEQKVWIEDALLKISDIPEVYGINYWVGTGGSTALWRDNGKPKPVVGVITRYYKGK